jgi:CRISPR-associated protein Csx17
LRLDEAIFAMTEDASATQDASARTVQRVLIAIGEAAAYLVSSPKARDPKEGKQKPPPRLRSAWFYAADDKSAEFRIAAALAGLGREPARAREAVGDEMDVDSAVDDAGAEGEDEARKDNGALAEDRAAEEKQFGRIILSPPLRAHLAPLDETFWYGQFRKWSDKRGLAVWGGGALERNLAAVIERRLLFAAERNLNGGPFDARAPADLPSVLAFLAGRTDDARIAALAQGLAWADAPDFISTQAAQPQPLPLAYALMKPFFAPIEHVRAVKSVPRDIRLPVPPGLVARLRAGDIDSALMLACRRARASGLPLTFELGRKNVADVEGPRLLAALLIPIRQTNLERVMKRAYPALFDDTKTPKENPADAA